MNEKKTKHPTVMCLPRPDFIQGAMFWCDDCNKFHLHGEGLGHRSTHCHENPRLKKGYILKMHGRRTLKNIRKAITEYLEL